MIKERNVKIIAFVSLAGGGKSSATEYLTKNKIPKVYAGGFIVQGVIDQGLEPTQENEKKYREEMRAKHGQDIFIKMSIDEMERLIEAGQRRIVFDGLYSWTEYKTLKHAFPGELTIVAVVTPKHMRYQRMAKRQYRPLQPHEVDQRDWAEIENIEKGGPIAIADFFIHNDSDLDNLHRQIDQVLEQINF